MGKNKKPAGDPLVIGEGVLAWATLSIEEANSALIAATGCSPQELAAALRLNRSVVAQLIGSLFALPGEVLGAYMAEDVEYSELKAALLQMLETLEPVVEEGEANGDS